MATIAKIPYQVEYALTRYPIGPPPSFERRFEVLNLAFKVPGWKIAPGVKMKPGDITMIDLLLYRTVETTVIYSVEHSIDEREHDIKKIVSKAAFEFITENNNHLLTFEGKETPNEYIMFRNDNLREALENVYAIDVELVDGSPRATVIEDYTTTEEDHFKRFKHGIWYLIMDE